MRRVALFSIIVGFVSCGGGSSVVYHGNGSDGGSVPEDATEYVSGDTVTVRANTGNLTKDGFAFVGWNTASDGTGETYLAGQTFTIGDADVDLHAVWTTHPTFDVRYHPNGATDGTVPVDPNNYFEGQIVNVLGNSGNLIKTGFNFAGWNTASNGSGASCFAGDTFAMPAARVNLFAVWSAAPTYNVTYHDNGATAGLAPYDVNNYLPGQTVTVFGNPGGLVRSDYAFAGWNTAADSSGTTYVEGETFTMGSADVDLYGEWDVALHVTYDANGATAGGIPHDSIDYFRGDTVVVLGNSGGLVRTSYNFSGWNTDADGTGTAYGEGEMFNIETETTLYAHWVMKPYTVTYHPNGATSGSVPVDPLRYNSGEVVTVLGNTGGLVSGSTYFYRWSTSPSPWSGQNYLPGHTFDMSNHVTLYAQYTVPTPEP